MLTFQFLSGLVLGTSVSITAWRLQALTVDGAIAAALIGTMIFGLGGLPWAVLLLVFFLTSSGLSRLFSRRKEILNEKFSKGSQRDWGQVAANGGLGTIFVVIQTLLPDQTWPWWAYAGALAAVNADTWATELGTLSRTAPRLITTWKKVEKGTSGGITLVGTLATLIGASLIGITAILFPSLAGLTSRAWLLISVITLAGFTGSLIDSLLGATFQAIYFCPACNKETERHPVHICGNPTHQTRGFSRLNNDAVNFVASFVGATLASLLGFLM